MVIRDLQSTKLLGGFNDCCDEAYDDMLLNVAIEEPHARILGLESYSTVATCVHSNCISLHWHRWEISRVTVESSFAG